MCGSIKRLLTPLAALLALTAAFSIVPVQPASGVQTSVTRIRDGRIDPAHEPVVQTLVDLVDAAPVFRAAMEAALLEQEPSSYWHGKTLEDMYTFFDEWLVFLPTIDTARLYMDRFYEFADGGLGQQLAARDPLRTWLYQFMLAVGEFNDSLASATAVPAWMSDPRIRMADYAVPPGGYQSFNEFFARRIKPGVRPIDSPDDPWTLTSPADSSIMKISDRLTSSTTIGVKGENLCIGELLGNDRLAGSFIDGKAVLCMLNTTDYHRYHAPVNGRIVSQRQLAGLYYGMDGGWVEYFFQHRRGYFILDTPKFGRVAMVCIGMFTISSVNFITSQGDYVNKGDEMGNFAYGGSAIILLFEPGRVSFTVPLEGRPVHVNMGQRLARAMAGPTTAEPPAAGVTVMAPPPSSAPVGGSPSMPVALPNVVIRSASLSASRVAPGAPVIVTAEVVNGGTANAATTLSLYVDGREQERRGVAAAAGSSIPVMFSVSRTDPGSYSVYVGAVPAGNFTVENAAGPTVVLYVSGALVLVSLLLGAVVVLRRR